MQFLLFVPYGSPSDPDRGLVFEEFQKQLDWLESLDYLEQLVFLLDLLDLGLVQDLLLVEWLQLARSDLPMTHSLYLFHLVDNGTRETDCFLRLESLQK